LTGVGREEGINTGVAYYIYRLCSGPYVPHIISRNPDKMSHHRWIINCRHL
jgi:hypothetical protein